MGSRTRQFLPHNRKCLCCLQAAPPTVASRAANKRLCGTAGCSAAARHHPTCSRSSCSSLNPLLAAALLRLRFFSAVVPCSTGRASVLGISNT